MAKRRGGSKREKREKQKTEILRKAQAKKIGMRQPYATESEIEKAIRGQFQQKRYTVEQNVDQFIDETIGSVQKATRQTIKSLKLLPQMSAHEINWASGRTLIPPLTALKFSSIVIDRKGRKILLQMIVHYNGKIEFIEQPAG